MSMMGTRVSARPSQIRLFLRADSAEELVRLQLQTNFRLKGRADFTDITFANDQWYAWYMVDIDNHQDLLGELLDGIESSAL